MVIESGKPRINEQPQTRGPDSQNWELVLSWISSPCCYTLASIIPHLHDLSCFSGLHLQPSVLLGITSVIFIPSHNTWMKQNERQLLSLVASSPKKQKLTPSVWQPFIKTVDVGWAAEECMVTTILNIKFYIKMINCVVRWGFTYIYCRLFQLITRKQMIRVKKTKQERHLVFLSISITTPRKGKMTEGCSRLPVPSLCFHSFFPSCIPMASTIVLSL